MNEGKLLKIKNNYLKYLPDLKDKKTKAYTTLILTFFALSIFGLFAINPTISTIAQLKKELSDNEFIDKRLTEKITNLNSLQNQHNALKNDLIFIENALPQKPEPAILSAQIQSLAKESGFRIDRLDVHEVELTKIENKNPKDFSSVSFSVSGFGQDKVISDFISLILNFERLTEVDKITVTKNKNEPSKLDLGGKVYFKR